MNIEREKIEFDVLFVGGGPAGLAGAIELMRLAGEKGLELEVALIEKGSEIGAHAISGAVLNPIALKELIPDYAEKGCPLETKVREDAFYFLTEQKAHRVPIVPKYMHNKGFYIISLSEFTKWLGGIAEELGVNIFPGFAGRDAIFSPDGKTIIGVGTGDKGLDKDGKPKGNFEPGIDLEAKITIFGEGARGSLTKEIAKKLGIFSGKMPQAFETGIKEVIRLPDSNNYFASGTANDIHTLGYPLDLHTAGGGFIYEMKDNRVSIGFLTGLSYCDPMLDLYEEFIKYKRHPFVANIIKGGKVVEQGARTVSTGGYYSMPKLAVNGGMFIGGAAGVQNAPGLKGIHVSMKSGMLAARAAVEALEAGDCSENALRLYSELFEKSWLKTEIYEGRNFSQAVSKPAPVKFIHLGAQYLTKGRGFRDPMPIWEDGGTLKPADGNTERADEKTVYDGELCVDKLTGVYLSKTMHREDQPGHIVIHDTDVCVNECYKLYRNPCVRFCPGNVYEIETDETTSQRRLKLNPANCLHCKTCDIKDPFGNVTWTCPEGGDGPGYTAV